MKKFIALAALFTALFNFNSNSYADNKKTENIIDSKYSYQESEPKHKLNFGLNLDFDGFKPYTDLIFDRFSQDCNLGIKTDFDTTQLGAVGGFLNSKKDSSNEKLKTYSKDSIITNGTSLTSGSILEQEALTEKISGYRIGGEAKFDDKNHFLFKVQYLNSNKLTENISNNLTKINDYYNEKTHETQSSLTIDTETAVTTNATVNVDVNTEVRESQNIAKMLYSKDLFLDGDDYIDYSFSYAYNYISLNTRIMQRIRQDITTKGNTRVTINNVNYDYPITSSSSKTTESLTEILQEIKQHVFGLRSNQSFDGFFLTEEATYDYYNQQIDFNVDFISNLFNTFKIGAGRQNGKYTAGIEIAEDKKGTFKDFTGFLKAYQEINDSAIDDSSKKEQLIERERNRFLRNRDWRLGIGYDSNVSLEAGLSTPLGFIDLGYNFDQISFQKLITPAFSIKFTEDFKQKKYSAGVEIPLN